MAFSNPHPLLLMKPITLFLSLFLFATTICPAEEETFRTFTDVDGREIEAVIVRAAPKTVWLRRHDGRTFRIPLARFAESDRRFIRKWRIVDALKRPDSLKFAVKRYPGERRNRVTERKRTVFEEFGYTVTLHNHTAFDLEDLEIEYRYYVRRDSTTVTRPEPKAERHFGRKRIALLPARGHVEFSTPAAELVSTSLRSNRTRDQHRTSDELAGIWIRIKYEQKLVAEFSKPGRLKEKGNW